MAEDSAACRRQLTALSRKDTFLHQKDQRPLLDSLLADMDTTVRETLEQAGQQLDKTVQQLDDELIETAGQLHKAVEQLAEEFTAVLNEEPLTPEAVSRLSRSIEARILWLYDRVRNRLDKALRRIAPKGLPLSDLLQSLADAWSKTCKNLPEELVLILDRQQQEQAAGRSIWEIEGTRILDQACNGHGYLTSRILYLRLRQQLRRRYKILRCEPCETLNRHLPAPLQKELPPALLQFQEKYEEAIGALADLWRNLRFNLETAAEDCSQLATGTIDEESESDAKQELEEISRVVGDTLARAAEQLSTAAEPLKQAGQQLLNDLDQDRDEILALIPRDMQRELSWQERAQHAEGDWAGPGAAGLNRVDRSLRGHGKCWVPCGPKLPLSAAACQENREPPRVEMKRCKNSPNCRLRKKSWPGRKPCHRSAAGFSPSVRSRTANSWSARNITWKLFVTCSNAGRRGVCAAWRWSDPTVAAKPRWSTASRAN